MGRAIIFVLDSFGIGASLDAVRYGDQGTNTFLHIAKACAEGNASRDGVRSGPLHIPNLLKIGLGMAGLASAGEAVPNLDQNAELIGRYGYAVEQSLGKDTPSGHWEMAGVPVLFEWGYFQHEAPSFPKELTDAFIKKTNVPGVLGNCHASGTVIIEQLGQAHIETGQPIIYTSADSVFQIAAHESAFGLERLYALCDIARDLVDDYNIGRVIARPFTGKEGAFERTTNRRDYATPPPAPTLLDDLKAAGRDVVAIGKIADIYAHQGVTEVIKAGDNNDLFDASLTALANLSDGALMMTNFVDFDSKYGHRRDVVGYANALEAFDKRLPEFMKQLRDDDLLILTADHGCDPTQPGSDHTREHIPVLAYGPTLSPKFIGRRETFADIGQSVATHLGIDALKNGISFI